MILSLDVETACNVEGCTNKRCKHALDPRRSKLLCVGTYYEMEGKEYARVFRSIDGLRDYLLSLQQVRYLGHNFKFDLHILKANGIDIPLDQWAHDTMLMAHTIPVKIPEGWMQNYEERRKVLNKKLPVGVSHRKAGRHSLKTLAPYHLGVPSFWENPADHDSDEYVIKDCKYTYKLYQYFEKVLKDLKYYDFYQTYFMSWARNAFKLEDKGVKLDLEQLELQREKNQEELISAKTLVLGAWNRPLKALEEDQKQDIKDKLIEQKNKRLSRLKKITPEKIESYEDKMQVQFEEKIAKLDVTSVLDSPTRLMPFMRDYLGFNMKDSKGSESTSKEVLQRLSFEKKTGIDEYLTYRKKYKLDRAFFQTYKELQFDSVLYPTYHMTGTRTGRLSASDPNLQQVERGLHSLFISRPGHLLGTFDMKAIEAVLIAYYSQDPMLLDVVLNDKDFHGVNAKIYFPEIDCDANEVKQKFPDKRDFAKEWSYSLFYGTGARGMQRSARRRGVELPLERCQEALDNFREHYRQVFTFKEKIDELVKHQPIVNLFGRPQFFEDHTEVYMKNFNTLIQSSASDLVQEGAKRINELPWIDVLLLVHDEIVAEFPEAMAEDASVWMKYCMTDFNLDSPMGQIKLQAEGTISNYWTK